VPFYLQYWWPEVPWFGQIVVFQADYEYDEIELQKYNYDVITIKSPKNVTKIMLQIFFPICPPSPQSKFLATPVMGVMAKSSYTVTFIVAEKV